MQKKQNYQLQKPYQQDREYLYFQKPEQATLLQDQNLEPVKEEWRM